MKLITFNPIQTNPIHVDSSQKIKLFFYRVHVCRVESSQLPFSLINSDECEWNLESLQSHKACQTPLCTYKTRCDAIRHFNHVIWSTTKGKIARAKKIQTHLLCTKTGARTFTWLKLIFFLVPIFIYTRIENHKKEHMNTTRRSKKLVYIVDTGSSTLPLWW